MKQFLYRLLLIPALLLAVVACTDDGPADTGETPYRPTTRASISLTGAAFDDLGTGSRAGNAAATTSITTFDRVVCHLFREGRRVEGLNIVTDGNRITIDGLGDGEYLLSVLAVCGDHTADGAEIVVPATPRESLLRLPENRCAPLTADYYFLATTLKLSYGQPIEQNLTLRHAVGMVNFDAVFATQYVDATTVDLRFEAPDLRLYTDLCADGSYGGSTSVGLGALPILDRRQFLLMPATQEAVAGTLHHTTRNHKGVTCEQSYTFETRLSANGRSTVMARLGDGAASLEGTIYGSERAMTDGAVSPILSDNEPKTTYYDHTQRWVEVNRPIQPRFEDGKLCVRYYCSRSMTGVKIWVESEATGGDRVLLAQFDRLPPFSEIALPIPTDGKERMFEREKGGFALLRLPLEGKAEYSFTSEDGLMAKFNSMTATWRIVASGHGGDPDQPDGGPNNKKENIVGIRPVHIRAAIGLLQNLAYCLSFDELHERVRNWDDKNGTEPLWDDKKQPIEGDARYEILRKMVNLKTLDLGLVGSFADYGVRGWAGGTALIVDQPAWLGVWDETGILTDNLPIVLHEMGHCMGYRSHGSCMESYGRDAYVSQQIFPTFFYEKFMSGDLPIDRDYEQAWENDHIYVWKEV